METVAGAMLRSPKTCDHRAPVREVLELFAGDHVHCALLVDGTRLVSVVTAADLLGASPDEPAAPHGRLRGRTIALHVEAQVALRRMTAEGVRRLAVVSPDGALQGLLCLKRRGDGFCSDEGVAARAAERAVDVRTKRVEVSA
ncbi:CBS domain-containing protein [Nocardioides sp. Kera G14]|uniref:CBS domain-containing protein n=1 Tax=Nocardioides sp. Kera G14 TaxID=2884264 RepID=UPI001D10D682|nr:CBS domain-containing protein [Nocardioides sp. Kera G14]UDY23712.1 CBS domain-containing protein [Nocardioides sp. Kera G14]